GGSFGSSSQVATFTVDTYGRLTSYGSTDISIDGTNIQSSSVVLGTHTTGNYVANIGALTGLSTSGNTGAGSTPTLAVLYGSTTNTAVQGDTSINCTAVSGTNLTGGG